MQHGNFVEQVEIIEDYPSRISAMLLNGLIDLGLVPIAVLPKLKTPRIITDYCIGANGDVASVALFSEKPLHEIKTILLDYQSETSVSLCKILCKHFWKINPSFESTNGDFSKDIKGDKAAVLIGDRALLQLNKSAFVYDLSGQWKTFTGLPFVFAAWVTNKEIDEAFINSFNEANKYGLENIERVISQQKFMDYDLKSYYTKNISYILDEEKQKGMNLFLELLQ